MSGLPERLAEGRRWLREASEELHAARTLLADEGSPARLTCFLAHLAAEKALKGILAAQDRPFPRTHDLGDLYALLPPETQAAIGRDDLKALNPWAIEGRYTDDLAEADEETSTAVIDAAERVLASARETIERRQADG